MRHLPEPKFQSKRDCHTLKGVHDHLPFDILPFNTFIDVILFKDVILLEMLSFLLSVDDLKNCQFVSSQFVSISEIFINFPYNRVFCHYYI